MASPAGPCEWCGGPQRWTIIRDEMYVSCLGGCLGLFDEGPGDPLTDSEVARWGAGDWTMEPPKEERVVPPEGGAAKMDGTVGDELPF